MYWLKEVCKLRSYRAALKENQIRCDQTTSPSNPDFYYRQEQFAAALKPRPATISLRMLLQVQDRKCLEDLLRNCLLTDGEKTSTENILSIASKANLITVLTNLAARSPGEYLALIEKSTSDARQCFSKIQTDDENRRIFLLNLIGGHFVHRIPLENNVIINEIKDDGTFQSSDHLWTLQSLREACSQSGSGCASFSCSHIQRIIHVDRRAPVIINLLRQHLRPELTQLIFEQGRGQSRGQGRGEGKGNLRRDYGYRRRRFYADGQIGIIIPKNIKEKKGKFATMEQEKAKRRPLKEYYLSLLAVFKNEAHILGEWIQHYLERGFQHIFLINDASTDHFLAVLQPFQQQGFLTLYHNTVVEEKCGRQEKIYNEYGQEAIEKSTWLAVLDLDEFLYSPLFFRLNGYFLSCQLQNVIQVRVDWVHFGSNGFVDQPESVVQSFTRCCQRNLFRGFKSIVQTDFVKKLGIHQHELLINAPSPPKVLVSSSLVVNHYPIQSLNFYLNVKCTRGDVNRYIKTTDRNLEQFKTMDINDVVDDRLARQTHFYRKKNKKD